MTSASPKEARLKPERLTAFARILGNKRFAATRVIRPTSISSISIKEGRNTLYLNGHYLASQ